MKYIKHNNTSAIELKNYPCHTQAVKGCVNLASDAMGAVCTQKQRDRFIHTQISLCQSMSTLKQKLNIAFIGKTIFCTSISLLADILNERFDK